MHVQVVKVVLLRSYVLLGREPCQALLKYENPQRVNPIHQNVDPQVKFETVNQVRFSHVPLCDEVLTLLLLDVFKAPYQVNTPALAHPVWFHDISHLLFWILGLVSKVVAEVVRFNGQNPSFGEEIVQVRTHFIHAHEVACQTVFSCDAVNTRVLVNFLPRVEFRKEIWADAQVVPCQIENWGQLLTALSFPDGALMVFIEVFESPL